MRIFSIFPVSVEVDQRQRYADASAAAGPGVDFECSAQMTDALLHTHQPQAANAMRIESAAVVLNTEYDFADFSADVHLNSAGLGVPRAVAECLLHHPVDAGFVFFG